MTAELGRREDAKFIEKVENGSFSPDGSIRIDINAGDNGQGAAAYALAHEITHFTEIYSPEKFQNLADLLIREAGENGISWENMLEAKTAQLREQKQYAGLEEQKLADLARSECIAEMCETILTDTDAAARLSRKLQAQDKGLWEKIKDFFTGLVERLKEFVADLEGHQYFAVIQVDHSYVGAAGKGEKEE